MLNLGELAAIYLEPGLVRPAASVPCCRLTRSSSDPDYLCSIRAHLSSLSRYLSRLAFATNHRASYPGVLSAQEYERSDGSDDSPAVVREGMDQRSMD
jgi:hypothetical protein